MKAISLWQPWASLIAVGEKTIETRARRTPHRGVIAIHAAKRWTYDLRAVCRESPFRHVLAQHDLAWPFTGTDNGVLAPGLPFGAIVAVADLVDVQPVEALHRQLSGRERAFGNYAPGRYGWLLENVRRLPAPVVTRGHQYIWTLDAGIEAAVLQQLQEAA